MTIEVPLPRFIDAEATDSMTLCISNDPQERARLAAALDPNAVVIMVPDRSTALALLGQQPMPAQRVGTAAGEATKVRPVEVGSAVLLLDELVVDRDRAQVTWAGRPIGLTHLEIEVLACLMSDAGHVWSHERLHVAAWGNRYLGDRDSVHSLVKRLRRKLRNGGVTLEVRAVRGVGFQLVAVA
jgi:two-component system, OmpR family, response regulator MtrA